MRGLAGAMMMFCSTVVPGDAFSHSWFDEACCSKEDCKPIDSSELVTESDGIVWTSKRSGLKHKFRTGELSPVDSQPRIRPSQDGKNYGCESTERYEGSQYIPPYGYCLYLGGGF